MENNEPIKNDQNSTIKTRSKQPSDVLQGLKMIVEWDRKYRHVESSLANAYSRVISIEKEIDRLQDSWQLIISKHSK
jgi:hypothetical protein